MNDSSFMRLRVFGNKSNLIKEFKCDTKFKSCLLHLAIKLMLGRYIIRQLFLHSCAKLRKWFSCSRVQ